MEFEELALKSIDPSLGPSITQLKRTPVLNEKEEPPKVCFPSRPWPISKYWKSDMNHSFIDFFNISAFNPLTFKRSVRVACVHRTPDTQAPKRFLRLDVCSTHHRAFYDYSCVFIAGCLSQLNSSYFLAIIPNLPFFFCVWRAWSHYRGVYNFPIPFILFF